VIGLLCAALGRSRDADLADLVALKMGVRVEREGTLKKDYHTAGGWHRRADEGYGVPDPTGKGRRTVLSDRYYLADADFLVGLEGDPDLLARLDSALARPVWQLCLGRKAFLPGLPVRLPEAPPWGPGLQRGTVEAVLRRFPWCGKQGGARRRADTALDRLRLMLETGPSSVAEVRLDVPLSFAERRFSSRFVQPDWVALRTLEVADVPLPTEPQPA
jgi:CRISPR system Cascade subunit CasD